jgi:hypothetical protein
MPDDLTVLGSHLFTGFQNGVGSQVSAVPVSGPTLHPQGLTRISAISRISAAARPAGMKFPQIRFAACAWVSGPKLAAARTLGGSVPSLTSPQHGHRFDCATCSVTSGSGAG